MLFKTETQVCTPTRTQWLILFYALISCFIGSFVLSSLSRKWDAVQGKIYCCFDISKQSMSFHEGACNEKTGKANYKKQQSGRLENPLNILKTLKLLFKWPSSSLHTIFVMFSIFFFFNLINRSPHFHIFGSNTICYSFIHVCLQSGDFIFLLFCCFTEIPVGSSSPAGSEALQLWPH